MAFDLSDYNDVDARRAEFRAKHPEGSLQPANPDEPFRIVTVGGMTYVAYTAAAYRTPDDPRPGMGSAWEPVPGLTPYTKNSELQNAETSAWGRAILAAQASDARKTASADEVRNRRAEQEPATSSQQTALADGIASLSEDGAKRLTAWWKTQGFPSLKSGRLGFAQAEQILAHLLHIDDEDDAS